MEIGETKETTILVSTSTEKLLSLQVESVCLSVEGLLNAGGSYDKDMKRRTGRTSQTLEMMSRIWENKILNNIEEDL